MPVLSTWMGPTVVSLFQYTDWPENCLPENFHLLRGDTDAILIRVAPFSRENLGWKDVESDNLNLEDVNFITNRAALVAVVHLKRTEKTDQLFEDRLKEAFGGEKKFRSFIKQTTKTLALLSPPRQTKKSAVKNTDIYSGEEDAYSNNDEFIISICGKNHADRAAAQKLADRLTRAFKMKTRLRAEKSKSRKSERRIIYGKLYLHVFIPDGRAEAQGRR